MSREGAVSVKYDKFLESLRALCREHECQIATTGYDGLSVWDLPPGDDPIYQGCIVDKTHVTQAVMD